MPKALVEEKLNQCREAWAYSGANELIIDAYMWICRYLLFSKEGKDIEWGLQVCEETKEHIELFIKEKTNGGDFWLFENYAQDHGQNYSIINKMYEVFKYESYWKFDSYMFYMEKKRNYDKRFYYPRRRTLGDVVKDLEDLEKDNLDTYGLSLPARTGKALAFDTPVLTRKGWKKHGELTILDEVIGLDGQFKKITAIHNLCKMEYKVTTSDGESYYCHGNHEWAVIDRRDFRLHNVETKKIAECVIEKDGHKRYSIPKKEVVIGEKKELFVDPYTLGAWLGDGRNTNPDLCGAESDYAIVQHIIDNGYELAWDTRHKTTGVRYYGFRNLRQDLQKYGMCHSGRRTQKHIPAEYLTADTWTRLNLLAGLLDTDGTLQKKDHRYQFTTNDEILRDDFVSLVNTFGWRTCVVRYESGMSSSGIYANKPYWVVGFNPTCYIPCQLERKQLFEYSKQRHITIEKVELLPDDSKIYGNCITVEGGIYRVGRNLTPTHNSTIMIFFLSWVGMKRPWSHNIMGGHSGTLVKRFFRGLENLTESDEYTFAELFYYWNPRMRKVVQKKSSDEAELSINLGKPDEFPTFSCRSFGQTWTGSLDVSDDGYFYVDDMIKDREHSLSAPRVEATWQDYQSKLDRTNDGAKKILVGTLWTVADPIVREEMMNRGNDRARFRKIPALNENDESNFQYDYKGFSTKYYLEMRERLDRAEWLAKYQQTPVVRESLSFPIEELTFVEEMPKDFKRVIAFCDPAFGSGDSCSMPVLADYGDDGIVIGWLHDRRVPDITIPRIVDFIEKYHIMWLQIEKNRGGDLFGDKVLKEMDKRGIHFCKLTFKNANVKMSKEDRISGYSGYIKRHFSFLKNHDNEYKKALDEVTIFSVEGRNLSDDAPDSLTGLAEMKDEARKKQAHIYGSFF